MVSLSYRRILATGAAAGLGRVVALRLSELDPRVNAICPGAFLTRSCSATCPPASPVGRSNVGSGLEMN